ncbi:MAG: hypothetical protein WCB12_08885 [Bryobacteraceae bacterium]
MDHLLRRHQERLISSTDLLELKRWIESDPAVPTGKWFKRFSNFTLAGKGELPSTFLTSGMAVEGEEVQ